WTVYHKHHDVLAECDQTSCRSVKEGYQMIHVQYLMGNFTLVITAADFSKRARYTCDCDDTDLCDVALHIEPLNTTLHIKPGEALVLNLDIPEEVEVLYNSAGPAGPSSGQICTVDGRSTYCKPEYTQRVTLTSTLELRGVTPSDSGVYTVMDRRNDEVIHTYTVTVGSAGGGEFKDARPDLHTGKRALAPAWVTVPMHQTAQTSIFRYLLLVSADGVMKSCSSALCILILLISTFTPGSESAAPTVTVKLHESATLPCPERCSGVVRWTEFFKPTEVLAECDQTSCRSVKEGYQMIHDQYLNGNFSLTITDADFGKRTRYTCDCDDTDLCDVALQIEPLNTTLHIKPGEALLLTLDIPDPVEVLYYSAGAAGPSSGQICTVDGRSLQCRPDYTQRSSLISGLELRGLTPSNSGVYTVRDKRNEEVIHIYTVSVGSAGGDRSDQPTGQKALLPAWVTVPMVMAFIIAAVLVVSVVRTFSDELRADRRRNGQQVNHRARYTEHRLEFSWKERVFGDLLCTYTMILYFVPPAELKPRAENDLCPDRVTMPSCRAAHYLLLLLLSVFSAGSESALPTVTVELHHPATLPCSERCSGVVTWTVFHKPTDVLAECDQTSCRSVKEGYQMIHDQYLKGNFSLTITDADFWNRAQYTCDCDGEDLCDVALKVECMNATVQIPAGGDLVLDLDLSDPVEVLYNSTGAAGPSRVQICTGDGHRLQCRPEYTQRASAALKLRGVTPPDSGVYTIRDTRNEEDVRIYSVSVQGESETQRNQKPGETCPCTPSGIRVLRYTSSQVMRSCGSAVCVLVLLVSTLTAGSESADPTVTVELHHPATLPCPKRCSGVVRWTVFHKPTEVLAECDQTSCRSVKEGYQMIHDQYLKGNFSLVITAADFSKRARYTSDCDGEDLCDVELLVERKSPNTTVLVTPGEALVLKLDVPDPVKVIYRSEGEAGPSSGQICTADGHSARCRDEYEQRASLVSSLQIGGMKTSDSGVYTVVDKLTEEVLHTYTVSVGPADTIATFTPTPHQPNSFWVPSSFLLMSVVTVSLYTEGSLRHRAEPGAGGGPQLEGGLTGKRLLKENRDPLSGSESALPTVTVELHHPATLPCSERCSGVVRWTVFHKPTEVLAECDQTSCRSVKEGYQMIHDQYLKGDLSLTITDADLRKRARYTSRCGGVDLCDVALKVECVNTTVQIPAGGDLVLDLDVSDPVEVLYNSGGAAGPSRVQICTGDGHQLQCRPKYTQRASAALKLRGVTPPDSGVYTIRDTRNEEDVRIYSVSVQEQPTMYEDQGPAVPAWIKVVLVVVLVAAVIPCAVLSVVCVRQRREIQLLQKGSGGRGEVNQNGIPMNGRITHHPEEQEGLSSPSNHLEHVQKESGSAERMRRSFCSTSWEGGPVRLSSVCPSLPPVRLSSVSSSLPPARFSSVSSSLPPVRLSSVSSSPPPVLLSYTCSLLPTCRYPVVTVFPPCYGSSHHHYIPVSTVCSDMPLSSLPALLVLTAVLSGQLTLANRVGTTWRDLNEPATLYCEEPCSGVETWEKTGVRVAECGRHGGDGFSCERRADGSTLTIPAVNYTTRGFYHTFCNGHVICFQNLQPNPHRSSPEAPAGGLLILDLFTLQPVTVTFSRTDGGSGTPVQMCTVEGRSLQCNPEYRDRVSVRGNSIELRDVESADSGVYTVREVNDGAALVRTVSVTVRDAEQKDGYPKGQDDGHRMELKIGAVGVAVGLVLGVLLWVYVLPRVLYLKDKCVQRLRGKGSSHRKQTEDEEKQASLTPVSESALPTVMVELHHPATLPCSERCSGVVRWTEFFKSTEVLAECNQTSCRSVKEGYQMIRDQYLNGTITAADLRKRARYTSNCDGEDLCDVHLQIEVSESAVPTVMVKFHESATLPCSERCSGVVRWSEFSRSTEVLAECDQTSCRSVKEGYQMIRDQYLKGNFSLTFTAADFSKKARYTCDCDGEDLCDVHLQIEALNTPVQMKPGEALVLNLEIPEEVEVLYQSTGAAGPSSGQICTVDGRFTRCTPEYTRRTSLTSALELRGATPSDSGVYTVMDRINQDALHVYTVTVQDGEPEEQDQIPNPTGFCCSAPSGTSDYTGFRMGYTRADCPAGAALPGWVVPVLVVLLLVCAVSVGMNVWQRNENRQLRRRPEGNRDGIHVQSGNTNHGQDGVQIVEVGGDDAAERQRLA
ncbi:hypothetical protein NFI96_024394, partial [Prochilodus magdalenae]